MVTRIIDWIAAWVGFTIVWTVLFLLCVGVPLLIIDRLFNTGW